MPIIGDFSGLSDEEIVRARWALRSIAITAAIRAKSQGSENEKNIVASIVRVYDYDIVDEAAKACKPAADYFGLPVEVVTRKLKEAAAEAARETTTHATAEPRLKWETDREANEDPATFAWRAYEAEAKAGTLHRGVIYSEDRELHKRLNSWLRSHDMPEGIDIPTLPEWNTRQLAKHGGRVGAGRRSISVRTEKARLYDAQRYRAVKPGM